ncbi:gamma-secretase subunit Aph-1b-like [Falco rusticolus]|uniref:gamma-secretase subunit Aph-1b-like n=1 Tax=Falco rusticolus TaxID=120794 RepID=UPI001886574B|nr:gamma-secretase subunit Aph-1b-like [Falco rusticolus]
MTLAIFFGCAFIAFGPTLGLFLFTIARDLLRIIILIAGSVPHRCRAFFWLVSLLLSSLIWFITVKVSDPQDEPLQKGLLIFGVMFSVLLQEAFRFLYYKLLSGWRGLWAHEWNLLHDQSSGRHIRAWHHGHPRRLTALLPGLSLYDHGADFPSHLLGDPLLPRL